MLRMGTRGRTRPVETSLSTCQEGWRSGRKTRKPEVEEATGLAFLNLVMQVRVLPGHHQVQIYMRVKRRLLTLQRPDRRDLARRLYEMRRPLILGVVALLLVIVAWRGYQALDLRREEAAQALLSRALEVLAERPGTGVTGHAQQGTRSRLEEALPLLARVREEYPSSSAAEQGLLQIAHILYRLGKSEQALGAYQNYLEEYPRGSWVFLAALGKAYAIEAQRDYRTAASVFRHLAERYRQHALRVDALMGLARSLEQVDAASEAAEVYRRVVEQYPGTTWSMQAEDKMAILRR